MAALQTELFDAKHSAEHWEESYNIEHDRATALEVECERLRRMMDHATPWRVSDPPTDDEMRAIRLRWANGPEKYQADADALIAAVIHGRQRETELQATLGCSYSTALKKVRDAEEARRQGIPQFPVVSPETVAAVFPAEAGWTTLYVGPTINHEEVRARRFGTDEGEK